MMKKAYIELNSKEYVEALSKFGCSKGDCENILDWVLKDDNGNDLPDYYFEQSAFEIDDQTVSYPPLADNILEDFSVSFFVEIFKRLKLTSKTYSEFINSSLILILRRYFGVIATIPNIDVSYTIGRAVFPDEVLNRYLFAAIKDYEYGTTINVEKFRNSASASIVKSLSNNSGFSLVSSFEIEISKFALSKYEGFISIRSDVLSLQGELSALDLSSEEIALGAFIYSTVSLLKCFTTAEKLSAFVEALKVTINASRASAQQYAKKLFGLQDIEFVPVNRIRIDGNEYYLSNDEAFAFAKFLIERYLEGIDDYYSLSDALKHTASKTKDIFKPNESKAFKKQFMDLKRHKWRFKRYPI